MASSDGMGRTRGQPGVRLVIATACGGQATKGLVNVVDLSATELHDAKERPEEASPVSAAPAHASAV